MNRRRVTVLIACCTLLAPWLAVAQNQTPQPPPKVLRIGREDVKPGKEAAHEKMETAWARAFIDAKVPQNWIGMTPVTGGNEAWYVTGLESLAEYEQGQQAMDKMAGARALGEKYSSQESEFLSGIHNIMVGPPRGSQLPRRCNAHRQDALSIHYNHARAART